MPNPDAKFNENPSPKQKTKHDLIFAAQICLRILAIAATLAATWIVITAKQSIEIVGITFDARYTYSPAFKYFAFANAVVCAFSIVTTFILFFFRRYFFIPASFFIMFLHDMFALVMLLSGCSAATAIGYVGQYGNSHSGWVAICDNFHYYCKKNATSVTFSYLAVVIYLVLTIISANKARQI